MFDVGFWELALVFGLGLVILGPERLPRVAAKVGRWVGQARRTAGQLRRQLEMEVRLDDPPTYTRPKPPPPTTPAAPGGHDDLGAEDDVADDVADDVVDEQDGAAADENLAPEEEPDASDTHGKD